MQKPVVVGNRKLDPEDLSVVTGILEFRFCKFSLKANFSNFFLYQPTNETQKYQPVNDIPFMKEKLEFFFHEMDVELKHY